MFRKRGGRPSSYFTVKNVLIRNEDVTLISAAKRQGKSFSNNRDVSSTVNLGFTSGIQIRDLVVGCLHFF